MLDAAVTVGLISVGKMNTVRGKETAVKGQTHVESRA